MHNAETHRRFIELRSQDLSLALISDQLHVSKPTLIAWQQKFREQIANLKSVELEALQEKVLASHELELSQLAGNLKRVEAALAMRDLKYVSTEFLFGVAASLRAQIRKQRVVPVFPPSPPDGLSEPESQPVTITQPTVSHES